MTIEQRDHVADLAARETHGDVGQALLGNPTAIGDERSKAQRRTIGARRFAFQADSPGSVSVRRRTDFELVDKDVENRLYAADFEIEAGPGNAGDTARFHADVRKSLEQRRANQRLDIPSRRLAGCGSAAEIDMRIFQANRG